MEKLPTPKISFKIYLIHIATYFYLDLLLNLIKHHFSKEANFHWSIANIIGFESYKINLKFSKYLYSSTTL